MFGLSSISLEAKALIFIGYTALVAAFVGHEVEAYVSTKYENILLNQKVVVVTREHEVAVLDQKTLQTALTRQKQLDEGALEDEKLTNDILRAHINDLNILNDYELCVWNSENKRLMGEPVTTECTGGPKLSNPRTSEVGQAGGPVGKQSGNP